MLARWGSWGALPGVFDERNTEWAEQRSFLKGLLDDEAYAAARRTTINAHYTAPEYVKAMWAAVRDLGFDGGEVLEPGCGLGTFIGLAPASAHMVGVELAPTTTTIASTLYPDANIRTESFADSPFPDGSFDAVIGNVPFADVVLHDPRHNPGRHSMHNHFLVKSLALTKPGGVVAALTSRYTLDATNPAVRREMYQLADLVGAVRLPSGAHRRAAGTDVVTDLLILRRRRDRETPQPFEWEQSAPVRLADTSQNINTYFHKHSDHVLGNFDIRSGIHGSETLAVVTDSLHDIPDQLAGALQLIAADAQQRGLMFSPASDSLTRGTARATELWDGTIVTTSNGFAVANSGALEPLAVPKSRHNEVAALARIRDYARDLLTLESTTREDTSELEARRAQLRRAYNRYVDEYGPINRYTLRRTGRTEPVLSESGEPVLDPTTGQPQTVERMARVTPPAVAQFRDDPHGPLLRSLENFDDVEKIATPATILTKRVLTPRPPQLGADTPIDALTICRNETGLADLGRIANLLGVPPAEARTQLGELVYDDPTTGQIVYAPEYLSGNVREKLAIAQAAALEDPSRYTPNVNALRAVQPVDLTSDQIEARMGSVWISPQIHQTFLRDILDDPSIEVEAPLPGLWGVKGRDHTILARDEWGTRRQSAIDIAAALMEQRHIEVRDAFGDTYVLNAEETVAAQEKAAAMQERFSQWVWENPERARGLVDEYNRRFNSLVLRDYEEAGRHLTFPGLASSIALRPHQRAAVARMLSEPAVGLFHEVGAGKTLEMVVGATELRRTGMIRKPMCVVPNHMLEQITREWLQAYPNAQLLAASTADLSGERRRQFIARAATNDWDAIVVTQSAFKRIPVSADTEATYLRRQLYELEQALTASKTSGGFSTKRIERIKLRTEERLKAKLAAPRDHGVHFEDLGVDYLLIDEAHTYKNLNTPSNIPGAAIEGSGQAQDLHMKLEWLRSQHGDRVVAMATATPLANSVTEAYIMQRYLRPDLLDAAGINVFDQWAATFGATVAELELAPAGGFRVKERFARFTNVPEMLTMWSVFADVKTSADLGLNVPLIAPRSTDQQRLTETIVLNPTPELEAFISKLGDRAERVAAGAVTSDVDNMLLISTDGRKAALDMRLVDPTCKPSGPVKLDAVADQVAKVWHANCNNEYLDDARNPSSIRGGLQLVFCDLGTPKPGQWNAYDYLKQRLTQAGVPSSMISYIHDAKNDRDKARLFASARAGHIQVLIGSTTKMGVGTNVQSRIVAMHHVDCPWRPADIQQRDGRGIRQGNQNPEVAIYRYVTERSFDAYSWQTVDRKARFIAQVLHGRLDHREIEDIGDTTLSAAEAKALASGNPLLLERANAEAAYQKLRRQHNAHQRAQSNLVQDLEDIRRKTDTARNDLHLLQQAETRTIDISGNAFTMTVNGQTYPTRVAAASALQGAAHRVTNTPSPIAQIAGHNILAHIAVFPHPGKPADRMMVFQLQDVPGSATSIELDKALNADLGIIRRLENKTIEIPKTRAATEKRITTLERRYEGISARIGQAFPHLEALETAKQRLDQINNQLAQSQPTPDHQDHHTPGPQAAYPPSRPNVEPRTL